MGIQADIIGSHSSLYRAYTECPRSLDPIFIVTFTVTYKMGQDFFDIQYWSRSHKEIMNGSTTYACNSAYVSFRRKQRYLLIVYKESRKKEPIMVRH